MGVATGCGCKEVYRFPHTTYPYSSCICSFLKQHPTFCSFKKMFFFLVFYTLHWRKIEKIASDIKILFAKGIICILT